MNMPVSIQKGKRICPSELVEGEHVVVHNQTTGSQVLVRVNVLRPKQFLGTVCKVIERGRRAPFVGANLTFSRSAVYAVQSVG